MGEKSELEKLKINCLHFNGDIPCKPHKEFNAKCIDSAGNDCKYFKPYDNKILIIKLGAIGDVIRTTPLYSKLRKEYPNSKFYWLTNTPEVVPKEIDKVLKYDFKSVILLESIDFDIAINLDKDYDACALFAKKINAHKKYGYTLKDGVPFPVNNLSYHKFLTGIYDDLNKKNSKNYLQEIFEICGFEFNGEEYILNNFNEYKDDWDLDHSRKIIGLNTGCGGRWTTRLWPDKYWIELANLLHEKGYLPLFLGGEQEHEKNKRLSELSKGKYLGYFELKKFINLIDQCDLVVSSVTMAMHITLALRKKLVLFNNIFNPNEFELYGLGEICSPDKKCTCFFMSECKNQDYFCMESLFPNKVLETVERVLKL